LHEIEGDLRYMLYDVFDKKSFFNPKSFSRVRDLADINGFSSGKLAKIFYSDPELNLNPFPTQEVDDPIKEHQTKYLGAS